MEGDDRFMLSPATSLPRIWVGLWQLSSNAWGSAPAPKVRDAMATHMGKGFFAFDMSLTATTPADHYGPAEDLFGSFVAGLPADTNPRPFGATKWCIFHPMEITYEKVAAAVKERSDRMHKDRVDLLQFFWQDYQDRRYITALQHLARLRTAGKIRNLGLCNFDTKRTEEVCVELGRGYIVSNQVTFSIIDVRPLHGMNDLCTRYGFKVLAYGTLCGGLLTDRWLGKPEPELYSGQLNPSQRKYLDVILKAWGDWDLFQTLLRLLRDIADRHGGVSIANVAIRWVLEHPFVGAVLIGARLGLSDNTDDNAKVFTFSLTDRDKADIEAVLKRSRSSTMIMTIGDCGAEYRQKEEY